jgi:two-component system, NtrC family, nitrogen regulation sensor histidine kinase NtrY
VINKTIYYNIAIRVSCIALTAFAACFLAFVFHQWLLAALGILLLIWQTGSVIYSLNRTNRQIAFLFNAIRNEDSTLHFPLKTGNRALDELNSSMNRLNDIIGTAKMQYRIQEQYFETIIEQAATGLLTFDSKGHVLLSNSATRRYLGLEPFTHISQLEKVEKGLSKVFHELDPNAHKLVNITNERGSMQLSLRATAMVIKNANVTLVSIQDIRNELDEKETESWIRLIRVLTHEIMNSIAPITSLSETISGYFETDGEIKKLEQINEGIINNTVKGLKVIRERGSGLVKFVESYRKLTHLHEPTCKTVGLQLFMDKVKLLLCSELNFNNISLSIQLQSDDMTVFADENLLSQVIINLVRNSWEALQNQENGKIQIKANKLPNNHTRLEVMDNGPGIPAELLDKIFVPFFTTREHGSGIGLSLSQQIIRLHGGNLSVKSQPGKTCFEVII